LIEYQEISKHEATSPSHAVAFLRIASLGSSSSSFGSVVCASPGSVLPTREAKGVQMSLVQLKDEMLAMSQKLAVFFTVHTSSSLSSKTAPHLGPDPLRKVQ
jgi:hypothetical protein